MATNTSGRDAPATPAAPAQIVFVDAAVADIEAYLPGFKGEVITLKADSDGLDQIAAALAGRHDLGAIHVISHGEAGLLLLGNTSLDLAGITGAHAADIAAIKDALSPQGDLLLYGCDIAAGTVGQEFIAALAKATSADVAASTDDTGSADLGGNWTLEAHVGQIETRAIDASGWEGSLAPLVSTGTWTVNGSGNATTATSTVSGVTTTVSFGTFSNATTAIAPLATAQASNYLLNNIAAFSPAVQNTASLGLTFTWDTNSSQVAATSEAAGRAGTGVITITFSSAVTNPVIHLDRLGGSDSVVQNGMRFTLVNPGGLSITQLAGTPGFAVDSSAGTIQTNQIDVPIAGGFSGESSFTANQGTAAGSVRVNGTVTSVQFVMSAAPNSNEGAGGDAFEMKVSFDPPPTAVNDSFATPHHTPITLNVRANDSDPQNDAITVTKVNGTAVTAGGAGVAVTGGSVALSSAGNLVFTPTAGTIGATSFTYAIADPAGNEVTATVTGNVTEFAPIVDLNSDSTSTQRVTNGAFTGGALGWVALGTTGTAGNNAYYWDLDGGSGTLTQVGLTGLDKGYGAYGAAQVTYDLAWNNGVPDSTNAATLDLTVGGVVYARLTTNADGANGTVAAITYLNGASGPVTSIAATSYLGWTYSNIVVNLPANVAATGSLQFSYNSNGGSDDISIDNVSVLTRTDNVAGNNYSTSYTENAAPVSIAATPSEVRDNDNANLVSATITLTNPQAGDVLSVTSALTGGIVASAYNPATGVITLSGSATLAQYTNAIRAIGYSSTSDNPSTVNRTVNVIVNDGVSVSNTAVTTITVTAVNDAPVAVNDTITTAEDRPLDFDPRTNDTDAENDAITITQVNGTAITADSVGVAVTGGIVVENINGNLTFVPNLDFSGTSTFTYQVRDPSGAASLATVTATVTPVNDAPVVDLNGPSATTTALTSDGLRDLTPPTNSWDVLLYSGSFAVAGTAAPSNADRTIGGGAGTPVLNGEIYLGKDDTPLVIRDASIQAGEKPQNVLIRSGNQYGGTYTANLLGGDFIPALGSVSQYVATRTMTAAGTVTLGAPGSAVDDYAEIFVNGARVASNLAFTYNLSAPLTASFNAGDVVEIRLTNQGGPGAFTVDAVISNVNYATSYVENAAPVSIASSSVVVNDVDNATIASATITLTNAQSLDLLSVAGTLPTGISASAYNVATGVITLSGSASRASYATAIGQVGFSSTSENPSTTPRVINTTVNDGTTSSPTAVTTISVTAVNDAPIAVNDTFTTNEDTVATINVRTNDSDPDGDTFTVKQVNGTAVTVGGNGIDVTGGVVTLDPSGNLVFTPTANYNGSTSFTYTIADPSGATSTATVTGTITPVDDAPVVNLNSNTNLLIDGDFENTQQTNANQNNLKGTTYGAFSSNVSINIIRVDGSAYLAGPDRADSGNQYVDLQGDGTLSQAFTLASAQNVSFGGTFSNRDLNNGSYVSPTTTIQILNSGGTVVATASALTLTRSNGGESWFASTGNASLAAGTYTYRVTLGDYGHVDSVFVRTGTNYAITYTENGAPLSITSPTDAVTDVDNANIATTTIVLTNPVAGDYLSVIGTLPTGITASAYNSATGTITLSGSAIKAAYSTALSQIGFASTSDNPTSATRTVNVTVSDGTLNSSTAVTTINVIPVNDAPIAVADSFTVAEDNGPVTINVRANDSDPENDAITVTQVNGTAITAGGAGVAVTGGVVTLNASGNLVYQTNANYNGAPTFAYTIADTSGAPATATVNGTVTAVNDAPTSTAPASVTFSEDASIAFIGANALTVTDVDGDTLTVALAVGNGTLTLGTTTGLTFTTGNGTANTTMTFSGSQAQINSALSTLSFAPTADYNGSATLSFNTSDGTLSTARNTAITINPVADIVADSVVTAEDTAITFNAITGTNGASADNFENSNRAVTSVTQGAHGSVAFLADGTLTYAPNADYNGSDTFTYTVTSGGVTETATETVTITAVNDAPTSTAPGTVTTTEDTTVAFTGANTLTVADVDSASLTVTLTTTRGTLTLGTTTGLTFVTGNGSANTTMAFSGTQAQLNTALASLTFAPTADYNGSAALTFNTSDGALVASKTVALTITPVADIVADSVVTLEDTAITFNAITGTNGASADNFESAGRAVTSVTQGAHGSVTFLADGTLTYTPNPNYNGSDTFTYTVTSGGATETATETVNITAVNDAPTSTAPSTISGSEDTAIAFSGVNALTVADIDSASLTVTLTVTNGTLTLSTTTGLTFGTGNGTGNTTMAFSGTQAQLNTALASLTFAPTADYNGSATLSFNTSDGTLSTARSTAITINPVADIVADSVVTAEDTAITFNAITGTNGTSADNFENAGRAVTSVTQGAHGSVTFLANGALSYTPNANYNGSDTFTYTVTSGGVTETATETVTITAVNDPPVAVNDSFAVNEDNAATINVRSNDSDVDGDPLHVTAVNGTAIAAGGAGVAVTGGAVTLDTSGNLVYTPTLDFNGGTSFTYTVADPSGATATATVAGTINPVNDPPVATDDVATVNEDSNVTGNVVTNDTDVDGDTLVVSAVAGSSANVNVAVAGSTGGLFTIRADGSFTFATNGAFEDLVAGQTRVSNATYTVSDGHGGTSNATLRVTVTGVNDAPTAVPDTYETTDTSGTPNGRPLQGNVLSNDSDPERSTLTVSAVNGSSANVASPLAGSYGTLTLNADGTFSYDVDRVNAAVLALTKGQSLTESFSYTASDGQGGFTTTSLTIHVDGTSDAPTAGNDHNVISAGQSTATGNVITGVRTAGDGTTTTDPTAADTGTALLVTQIRLPAQSTGSNVTPVTAGTRTGTYGTLTIDSDGSYGYALANGSAAVLALRPGQQSTDMFVYTVTSGGTSVEATLSIAVSGANTPPVAVGETFTTLEDTGIRIDVRANDSDPNGDPITVTAINGVAVTAGGAGVTVTGGSARLSNNGAVVFTPDADFNGPTSFTYTISDPSGATSTATVTGTVTAVNDPPVANNDTFMSAEDTVATIAVIANDTDVDGDTLHVTQVAGTNIVIGGPGVAVSGGVVTLDSLNRLVFTPTANFNGATSFTYTVADPSGATSSATVGGTITPVNDPPVAVDDSFTSPEDTAATINVVTNDTDVDGDVLHVTAINGTAVVAGGAGVAVTGGSVALNGAGNLVFTPTANDNGATTFTYTVADPTGATSTATVSGTVTPVNDPPTAVDDTFTVAEDMTAVVNVRTNDSDVDGDSFNVTQVNGSNIAAGGAGIVVTGGVVTLDASGNLVFTPNANYNGSTSFSYTIADPSGATAVANVAGTVTPVNDPPVAANDSFTVAEDNAATVNVLANDTDVDGDTPHVTAVNGTAIIAGGVGVTVTGGVVTLDVSGNLTFTPNANYDGTPSFTYTIADPSGAMSTATVSGTVTPVNDPPVANNDSFTSAEDTVATINVRGNDTDVDGDPLTITQVNGTAVVAGGASVAVTGGSIALDNAGSLVFTPTANYNGSTSFTYTVADPSAATSTATVGGTITAVNDPPVAVNDSFNVNEDNAATINVRSNDTDVDGDPLHVTAVNGTAITAGGAGVAVTGGAVTLDTSGNLVYTPTLDFNGGTSFTYTVADPSGATATATVAGMVNAVNDPPVAVADSYTIAEDTVGTFNVLANDRDPDGDPITLIEVNGQALQPNGPGVAVSGGVITLDNVSNLIFTPTANYNGPISFTYTISDPSGATGSATVGGSVTAVDDPPVANDDSFTIAEDNVATIDVRANDSDVDGDPLHVTQVNGLAITTGGAGVAVTGGVVTLDTSGRLVFTPTANYNGSASFAYTVADPSGATSTATVSGSVTAVNDPPVANNDSFTVAEDNSATINVRANDTDVENDPLTVTQIDGQAISIGGPGVSVTGGVVTLDGAGNVVFTPSANYNGSPSFTYTIADPSGATSSATIGGTVTPVNDIPVAVDDSVTVGEDSNASGNAVTNDTDADGDTLTVIRVGGTAGAVNTAVAGSAGGLFTVHADGSYTFATNGQFDDLGAAQIRSSSITYTVSDGHGGTSTATISVNVTGVDDAPIAVADVYGTTDTSASPGGVPLIGNVLLNDTDIEHDTLSVSQVDGSAANVGTSVAGLYGSLRVNGDGALSYSVDRTNASILALQRGQTLTETFSYQVSDGNGGLATTTLSIRIDGTNDSPIAGNDSNNIAGGQASASGNVVTGTRTAGDGTSTTVLGAQDIDPNGDPLTIDEIRRPTDTTGAAVTAMASGTRVGQYGTLTIDAAGNYVYTLDNTNATIQALSPGQQLGETFVYSVTDGTSNVEATIAITIGGSNDNPVAVADTNRTLANNATTGNVLSNDADPDSGQTLSVAAVAGAAGNVNRAVAGSAGGLFTINADGSYAFDPNNDFVGVAAGQTRDTVISYTVTDGQGGFGTATVTVTVTGLDDAPTANADSFVTSEDMPVTINVRANDTDPDGDGLTVVQVNGAPITAGGPVVVVPSGTVALTAGGDLLYTPSANYNGSPSFSYTVSDPSGATSSAFVIGSVTPLNDPPVANNDGFTIGEDTAITIDVRANDTDAEGDPLTVTRINGTAITSGGPGVAVTGGVVTLDGAGGLAFAPNRDYNGPTSFTYTVADPSGGTGMATVSGTITAVDDAPVAVADSAQTLANTPIRIDVLANDFDVDSPLLPASVQLTGTARPGDPLVVAGEGTWTIDQTAGAITFTPLAGLIGTATTVDYSIADGQGARSTPAALSVTVRTNNRAPVANPDTFVTATNAPVTFDVRGNDTDPDNDPLTVRQVNGVAIGSGGPAVAVGGGTIAVDGSGRLVFTPTTGYNGAVDFTYTVADPLGATSTAGVHGTVAPVNHPPVANPDSFGTAEDTPLTIDVRANDTDVDGDALTVTQINGRVVVTGGAPVVTAAGSFALDVAGNIRFAPAPDYGGPVSFSYTVRDPSGATATATASGTVTPVDDAPVANADSFVTVRNAAVTIDVVANDTDVDGDALTVTQINGQPVTAGGAAIVTAAGSFALDASGNVRFTPVANYVGPVSFSYTVRDPSGATSTATASGTVTTVNHPPVANPDSFGTAEDTPLTIDVRANDTDVDGDALTVTQINGRAVLAGGAPVVTAAGSFALDAAGNIRFAPAPDYDGPVSFSYTVRDPSGATATATASGTVTPVNDTPVANEDSFVFSTNTPSTIDVIANDRDVDGDRLVVTRIDGAPITLGGPGVAVVGGVVTLDAAGRVVFTPAANAAGPVSFSYTVADPSGATATAAVSGVTGTAVANADVAYGEPGAPVRIAPLANDVDGDGKPLTITAIDGHPIIAGGPAVAVDGGTVALAGDGTLLFVPAAGSRLDRTSFTYTITDPSGATSTATIALGLNSVTNPPLPGRVDGAFPGPIGAPIATSPALYVLESVSDARTELSVSNASGGLPADVATAAEIVGGTRDDIRFAAGDAVGTSRLIRRDANLTRDAVNAHADTLYVQHAVRHESLPDDQALFVTNAVRQSQSEARLLELRASLDGATIGTTTLTDPFAVGAPHSNATPVARQEASRDSPAARGRVPVDALQTPLAPQKASHGFSAQLRHGAQHLHVRHPAHARTVATIVPRDKGPMPASSTSPDAPRAR